MQSKLNNFSKSMIAFVCVIYHIRDICPSLLCQLRYGRYFWPKFGNYLFVNKIVDQYVQILYCGNRKSYASEDSCVAISEKICF